MSKLEPGSGRAAVSATANHAAAVERPVPSGAMAAAFGSDVVAETLRALDIPYIALNPGASYRGLHDSIVNFLGNERPQLLLCLHEESAVAIAHGYAKVTGRHSTALNEAIAVVERGGVAVVDARIVPSYSPAAAAAMARGNTGG